MSLYNKVRLMNPAWCHCKIPSPSAHHENCINEDCQKFIPSNGKIAGAMEKWLDDNQIIEKALKWEAFMSSHQFKVYGSGGLGNMKGCQHMGMEIWDRQPEDYMDDDSRAHHERSKQYIETYVCTIMKKEL